MLWLNRQYEPKKRGEKMKKTIFELAEIMSKAFETRKRNDGKNFYCIKDEYNIHQENTEYSWINNIIHDAHMVDDVMPNDYIYQFIRDAVDIISECETEEEIEERFFEIEADIYYADLFSWVSDNLNFSSYVDEAMQEFQLTDLCSALQYGQQRHKEAIAFSVFNSLKEISEK